MRGKAVHNIVVDYLKDQSLDGLASDELGCDCELSDLAPCGDMRGTCLAARKHWLTVEDIERGVFDHLDEPPSRDHVGHYWVMIAVERDPR